ncbi:MAG: hypothetical protein KG003_08835 [Bacteroidetes bacterium]|nr:hypothetical protein [Bacteroidota bacterium]
MNAKIKKLDVVFSISVTVIFLATFRIMGELYRLHFAGGGSILPYYHALALSISVLFILYLLKNKDKKWTIWLAILFVSALLGIKYYFLL